MSSIDPVANFSLNDISLDNLKDIKIKDASDGLAYGRRFTLNIDGQDLHSDPLIFKDIFAKVKELSQNERRGGTIDNLVTIYAFLDDLKQMDASANATYKTRAKNDWTYKVRTWFHRLGDFGKTHAEKIDSEIAIIDSLQLGVADRFNQRKLEQSLAHQDPAHAEQALNHLTLQPEERANSIKDIVELYFEKGDSVSLKAAYGMINQLDEDERFNPTMMIAQALVDLGNSEDTLYALDIMKDYSWKPGESYNDYMAAATKVCDAVIRMVEAGDPSGLAVAKRLAVKAGLNDQFARLAALEDVGT